MDTKIIHIAILALLTFGCGSSSTSTRQRDFPGEGGEAGQSVVDNTGGAATSSVGGSVGYTGGMGGEVVQPTGGTGNEPVNTGGTGGTGATPDGSGGEATGGTGNVGGGCEPWDCTNIAINLTGWTPDSGEPIPESCGLIQDPCTGQYLDCGGCDAWHECGASDLGQSNATLNICGSLCVEPNYDECYNQPSYPVTLVCEGVDTYPQGMNCVEFNSSGPVTWCCAE